MSDAIEKLRGIGAQKIHQDTHIAREYAQAIIHETFDDLKSVQFQGFISILEREYDLDLSELRAKGLKHFQDLKGGVNKPQKVFIAPKKKKNYAVLYKFLSVALFISAVAYTFVYLNSIPEEALQVDDTKINSAAKSLSSGSLQVENIQSEQNITSDEVNETAIQESFIEENEDEQPKEEIVQEDKILKIFTNRKVWIGIVEIDTNKKRSLFVSKEYEVNASKNWLFLIGSGAIDFDYEGEKQQFSSSNAMRFKFVDGNLSKIGVTEFKSLNKGRKW